MYNHCTIGPRAECVGCLFQVQRTVGELIVGVDECDDQLLTCYGLEEMTNTINNILDIIYKKILNK